jgi:Na+/H+ antiporter NhaD/arsenite permease-like protein
MRINLKPCLITAAIFAVPQAAFAAPAAPLDLTGHWVGLAALTVFAAAYALVISEEASNLRKSKPMVVAAGILWVLLGGVYSVLGQGPKAAEAFRHIFLEYAELLLFLIVAMSYVNALEERHVFDVLRARLIRSRLSYRTLFWLTGALAFFLSPVADNLTTALVMGAVVMAVGSGAPRFVALSCINIVVAANAGGAFSPFGDITTLMVWQKGLVGFGDFLRLFLPSLASFVVPAVLMHAAVPRGLPVPHEDPVRLKIGARRIMGLFVATIATAVAVYNFLGLPPVLGMLTGLGYLQLLSYHLQQRHRRGRARGDLTFDVFHRIASVEWDALLFFYGVMMCIGALGLLGYLSLMSQALYTEWGATPANVLIGVGSAILDNVPLIYAVLTMHPDMSLGQWLLITLTAALVAACCRSAPRPASH